MRVAISAQAIDSTLKAAKDSIFSMLYFGAGDKTARWVRKVVEFLKHTNNHFVKMRSKQESI